jgi:hypothetical protein
MWSYISELYNRIFRRIQEVELKEDIEMIGKIVYNVAPHSLYKEHSQMIVYSTPNEIFRLCDYMDSFNKKIAMESNNILLLSDILDFNY